MIAFLDDCEPAEDGRAAFMRIAARKLRERGVAEADMEARLEALMHCRMRPLFTE